MQHVKLWIVIEYSAQSLQIPRFYAGTDKRKARDAFDGRIRDLNMTVKNGALLTLRTKHSEMWQMGNTAVALFSVQMTVGS